MTMATEKLIKFLEYTHTHALHGEHNTNQKWLSTSPTQRGSLKTYVIGNSNGRGRRSGYWLLDLLKVA